MGTKFTDQLLAHLAEKDVILESNDKERRSEASDEEAYALVYWGRCKAFSREWGAAPFLSFLVLNVWSWPPVGVHLIC